MGNTKLANPAPLGLMGFGMTTILLNLHNVGYFALDGIILAMGIFYGGIAQIFAGLLEYKKGNTFGLTAFTSYGSFWLAIGNIAGNAAIIHFAGWIGLICGASAIYLAMGEVLNEQFGRTVLPIGESH